MARGLFLYLRLAFSWNTFDPRFMDATYIDRTTLEFTIRLWSRLLSDAHVGLFQNNVIAKRVLNTVTTSPSQIGFQGGSNKSSMSLPKAVPFSETSKGRFSALEYTLAQSLQVPHLPGVYRRKEKRIRKAISMPIDTLVP